MESALCCSQVSWCRCRQERLNTVRSAEWFSEGGLKAMDDQRALLKRESIGKAQNEAGRTPPSATSLPVAQPDRSRSSPDGIQRLLVQAAP
ncbi:hypothetical protein NQZ68_036611, partial [Dissostichus eleginoides]